LKRGPTPHHLGLTGNALITWASPEMRSSVLVKQKMYAAELG